MWLLFDVGVTASRNKRPPDLMKRAGYSHVVARLEHKISPRLRTLSLTNNASRHKMLRGSYSLRESLRDPRGVSVRRRFISSRLAAPAKKSGDDGILATYLEYISS